MLTLFAWYLLQPNSLKSVNLACFRALGVNNHADLWNYELKMHFGMLMTVYLVCSIIFAFIFEVRIVALLIGKFLFEIIMAINYHR